MDNQVHEFLAPKHEELLKNKGIILLNPEDTMKVPNLKEIKPTFKNINSFYIGEGSQKRIVLQYVARLRDVNYIQLRSSSDSAFYKKNYQAAIEGFKNLLAMGKKSPRFYARIGLSYLYLGDLYTAIDYLIVATERSKGNAKEKLDFTALISDLLNGRKKELEEPEEEKPNFEMQEEEFKDDLNDAYGLEKIKDIAILINFHGMTIEEACKGLNLNADEENLVMLYIAKECYATSNFDLGNKILQRVEKMPNKTPRVKNLLEEIRTNRLFYKNRLPEGYQPLIRVRVKTH